MIINMATFDRTTNRAWGRTGHGDRHLLQWYPTALIWWDLATDCEVPYENLVYWSC